MKLKSIVCILLSLGLICSISACGGSSSSSSDSNSSAQGEGSNQDQGNSDNQSKDDSGNASDSSDSTDTSSDSSDSTDSSSDTSDSSSSSSDRGAQNVTYHEASSNNTSLSAETVTVSINGTSVQLKGAYVVNGTTATIDGGTFYSTDSDQNVFLVVNGGQLTISNAKINKSGDASTNDSKLTNDVSDDYNFYGLNSVVLVVGTGSSATITDTTITSESSGSNAIFALNGATIDVSNTEMTTTGNSSRGVYATYKGTVTADHVTITTSSAHCAPIATDRGGGTVKVTNSLVSSSGDGSPSIYSTGAITVKNIGGTSNGAQAAVIEGKNSISIDSSDFVVSNFSDDGIMIYQSMSGDASDSDASSSYSTFTINDSTVKMESSGPLFYVTNTTAKVYLNGGNQFTYNGNFLNAATGNWGTSGKNGGTVTMTVTGDSITGDITADSVSSVNVTLGEGASFTGNTSGDVTLN